MDCVDGMVKETTREATCHKFEPRRTRIYLDAFFLRDGPFSTGQPVPGAAAGTKGAMRPVLMVLFPAVSGTICCLSHLVVEVIMNSKKICHG